MCKAIALVALVALAGCVVPIRTTGSDRAVSLYREGRSPSGALAVHREGRARGAKRGSAARSDGGPIAMGIDDAVLRAKENSAKIAELSARADAALAGVEGAGQYRNPELQVTQLRLDQIAKGEPHVKPSLRFSPHRPGEIDAKMAAARAIEAEARADVRAEEMAIEADVRWLCDDLLLLDAELAIADRAATTRRALSQRMKDRAAVSEATAIDETMAELFAVEAEQDGALLRARRATAMGELTDRLGLDPATKLDLRGDPISAWPPPPLPSEQALVETALRNSPRVAIAGARIDGADARLSIERGKRLPWFTFVELGYEAAPEAKRGLAWTAQAGVEVPLFNTNGAAVRAASASIEAERRALAAEVDRVARDVRSRVREVEAAASLVSELRDRAIPLVGRADLEAKRALENSGIDVVRALVIDERRLLVELRFLRVVRRHHDAIAELRRAVGGRLPAR